MGDAVLDCECGAASGAIVGTSVGDAVLDGGCRVVAGANEVRGIAS